jgi:DNA-directed RNA polymerase specialized sigma24 family protein
MNALRLAAVPQASPPGVLAELFDCCGDQVFAYCWCLLRNREIAEMALQDTFATARAHIMRLENPESARSWLYWFARAECRRAGSVPAADEPVTRPGQGDDSARLIAWNTVMSLDAAELEALDLEYRHDVKPELVLGMPPDQVRGLVYRARLSLERALSAEIVISRGIPDCPDRAEVMAGWSGAVTAEIRDRTLRHAADCPACGPTLPRNVSPARVLAMLPWPALSASSRAEVLRLLHDPRPQRRRRLPWVRGLLAGGMAVAIALGCVLVGVKGLAGT